MWLADVECTLIAASGKMVGNTYAAALMPFRRMVGHAHPFEENELMPEN